MGQDMDKRFFDVGDWGNQKNIRKKETKKEKLQINYYSFKGSQKRENKDKENLFTKKRFR